MPKFKLDVDALQVESFETWSAPAGSRGTVRGAMIPQPRPVTDAPSCNPGCFYSLGGTCDTCSCYCPGGGSTGCLTGDSCRCDSFDTRVQTCGESCGCTVGGGPVQCA